MVIIIQTNRSTKGYAMSSYSTSHTVLALMTEPKRVSLIAGHESIFKTTSFTNARLSSFAMDDFVLLRFDQTPARRYLSSAFSFDDTLAGDAAKGAYSEIFGIAVDNYIRLPKFHSDRMLAAYIIFLINQRKRLAFEGGIYERAYPGTRKARLWSPTKLYKTAANKIGAALLTLTGDIHDGATAAVRESFQAVNGDALKIAGASRIEGYSYVSSPDIKKESSEFFDPAKVFSPEIIASIKKAGADMSAELDKAGKAIYTAIDEAKDMPATGISGDEPKTTALSSEEIVEFAEKKKVKSPALASLDGARWVEGIYIRNRDLAIFNTMRSFKDADTANILMVGPSGCGKTSIPTAFAKSVGMDVIRINCAAVRDPEEWFGYREAIDGSTEFVPTDFTKKVRQGNAIIILDEFNRVEPWLHNTLLPLLDHDRKTVVHNEEIKCGPNTIFVATMNLGASFTGTFMLDAAILNRFDAVINVENMDAKAEAKLLIDRTGVELAMAQRIVTILGALRHNELIKNAGVDVSSRSALKVAKLAVGNLLDIRTAIGYVVLNLIDDPAALKSANDTIIANL